MSDSDSDKIIYMYAYSLYYRSIDYQPGQLSDTIFSLFLIIVAFVLSTWLLIQQDNLNMHSFGSNAAFKLM